jgi:molybdopterin/thiamine biosynthesis adenylyltransferase
MLSSLVSAKFTLSTLTLSTSAISIANSSFGTNTSRNQKHWSVSRHRNHIGVTDYHLLQVAKESAAKFNPHVKLQAHHANIKDPQFNIEWFQQFNLVFNALDNLDARRHVNKMCLAADVPLIESGTTGFNGQVQVIKKVCNRGMRGSKSNIRLQC